MVMQQFSSIPAFFDHFHEGLIEILGKNEADQFVKSRQSEQRDPQTRGILIKAGRAGFYYWLRQNRETAGWNTPTFRLNPIKKKITNGLKDICENLEKEIDTSVQFFNEDHLWKIDLMGKNNKLPCSYVWGFVQEFTRWAGTGRFYEVRESICGFDNQDHCELVIKKDPQD